jgi:flagellar biosynthesis/type III secretory pathway chaperone
MIIAAVLNFVDLISGFSVSFVCSSISSLNTGLAEMSGVKKVRFSADHDETKEIDSFVDERKLIDISVLLKDPVNETEKQPKRKRRKKKTEFQKLKTEKNKLLKELKKKETSIREDSERKGSADYTPFENRQRLARSASEIQSKVKQLEGKISTKGKIRREKIQNSFKTKIKIKSIKAGKQHGRLIDLTSKLDALKLDEEQLRLEIIRDKSVSSLSAPSTSSCHSNAYEMVPPENEEMEKWVEISDVPKGKDAGEVDTMEAVSVSTSSSPELELYRLGSSSLSNDTELSLEEKVTKAEKLARKYDFTRELRNIMHEHMISRSYSYSYTKIIAPYKHKNLKPKKTKQSYNRVIYEDKMNVLEFAKKQHKLPAID